MGRKSVALAVALGSAAMFSCTDLGPAPGTDGDGGNGSDGRNASPDASVFASFTPSNITEDLVGDSRDIVIAVDTTLDTTTGSLARVSDGVDVTPTGLVVTEVAQPNFPSLTVISLHSLLVNAGATLFVTGPNAVVFAASGPVRIDGVIDASGGQGGFETGGPGGFGGGVQGDEDGKGPGGGSRIANSDPGGGGGGHGGHGGQGGAQDNDPNPAAGAANGVATLEPLVGGSGGGLGGGDSGQGRGGGGGGAVQITCFSTLTVSTGGSITVGGSGGEGGALEDGGGGGGAGGAILLEATVLAVDGAVTANGGGGGAGANVDDRGTSGTTGGVAAAAAPGGLAAGEGTAGGNGGSLADPAGQPGFDADTGNGEDNCGGGGGGAGRVVLRGVTELSNAGVVSPAPNVVP